MNNRDLDAYFEAMLDEATEAEVELIRWGMFNNPIVGTGVIISCQAGRSTRQALQWITAALIEQVRTLSTELANAAANSPPKPITVNGVTYTPIASDQAGPSPSPPPPRHMKLGNYDGPDEAELDRITDEIVDECIERYPEE